MTKTVEAQSLIKPGIYNALWGGWQIEIVLPNGSKSGLFKVNEGIRCISCKCTVEVKEDGFIYVIDEKGWTE